MEAANGAIEHDFHNALVPINGSHSGSSGRSTPNGGDPAPGKLFVGGLSWQTSSEKLREYFGMFGTVTDVLIMKDPVTQVGLLDGSSLRRLVHLYRWPVSPVLKSKSKERLIHHCSFFSLGSEKDGYFSKYVEICARGQATEFR